MDSDKISINDVVNVSDNDSVKYQYKNLKYSPEFELSISDKVIRLIMAIAENDFISMNEVGLLYGSMGYRYNVIRKLVSMGYVNRLETHVDPSTAYYLTSKGYNLLAQRKLLRIKRRFNPSYYRISTCVHTLMCAGARLAFERDSKTSNWSTEKVLKGTLADVKRHCDAEFEYGAWHCGLELELTVKNPIALRENLRRLGLRKDLDAVFWVSRGSLVFKAIRRLLEADNGLDVPLIDGKNKHFFGDYQDLTNPKQEMRWSNWTGNAIKLAFA